MINIFAEYRIATLRLNLTLVFSSRERNNTWALERAKANVVRWYPVVGILDYMEESLIAFAAEFPYFFKGATRIYEQFRAHFFLSFRLIHQPNLRHVHYNLASRRCNVCFSCIGPKDKHPRPASSLTLKLRIEDASSRRALVQEVEFYEWLKSRLLDQIFNSGRG